MTHSHLSRLTSAAVSSQLWKCIFCLVRWGCGDFQRVTVSPPKYRADPCRWTPLLRADCQADSGSRARGKNSSFCLLSGLLSSFCLAYYSSVCLSDPALPAASRCCTVGQNMDLRTGIPWNKQGNKQKMHFRSVQKFSQLKCMLSHAESRITCPPSGSWWSMHCLFDPLKQKASIVFTDVLCFLQASPAGSRIIGFLESWLLPFPSPLGTICQEQAVPSQARQANQDLALLILHLALGIHVWEARSTREGRCAEWKFLSSSATHHSWNMEQVTELLCTSMFHLYYRHDVSCCFWIMITSLPSFWIMVPLFRRIK